ncbi:1,4-dihydroxy-2-naphthoate polyprenyltransferase [Phycicoccus sp. 3266]|jgi:1,4-dihydroxy-2-naphthoate octaprenyltransferase|uniref:1,4-dihydroxy-2-naphthoate polyprenyltransferase n=1 Tax=Phycicoccus sp. 3266 TaxID=2817751 RepID=UPI002862C32A|nr:1,4-dihydroxy-2-naphthoate polyprenyltransferase [Phycicoccus sp. 3266]MDR6863762.1 1,4-dihydroxy-2-naphthoate octaprenyltransferase [Phycicoccus sp. 3266]
MATPAQWVAGARPRTLPAAIAPVVVGTAAAYLLEKANLGLALLALLVSVSLQVGVNYANDYSDGIRGTDAERVGPVRLVGQHKADPENVKLMAFAFFGFAALVGLALVALSQAWIMIPLGALAVLAAWRYTGGDNPYGYRGLGELYVFVFFGLMATLGTLYTQAGHLSWTGLALAVGVGAIASAILVANNLRDIPTDRENGKLTLAVRLGDRGTRLLYVGLLVVALAMVVVAALDQPWALLALLAFAMAWKPVQVLRSGATGRDLVPVLATTGLFEVAYAVLLAIGLVVGHAVTG